ncbi:mannose-1-phosphate guanyltransferase alpha isoform X1 [Fukomys damarensis]|uniref:mannose-1-phosphate guanyltransferase alpha isoform X1 n=1 Tax=Fukomys damarensis TaxID=885580 RepID=UPI0008FF438A|nr:mannose-1-phosphate guanyltransferase alpha isoform X1 [Fukomys damarensis]XP_010610124.2 mannose-1-phosphate guanyltransferase alpha isoform X1 [Fukomys damarensis]XP_010610125.2 mannose-1-phosphate guanyltransferase alpha isoform X1 [Fukomys damarensis]XP_033620546.1 mannose-1-phosphate guanyltransferase alpha isoform X1 [Fukomys damarensis]
MLKAVILIGGPQKGTRFRPLSFEVPKPLFPVAGVPMIQHHIEACAQVPGMQEILLIGFYQPDEALMQFLEAIRQEFNLPVRYLQEFAPLGTGGGLYHFRDQILAGGPEAFFVLNADVCSDFPLSAMLDAHRSQRHPFLLLGTTANRTQSLNYGCIVENPQTHEVLHYVEKPSTFISDIINCGIYLFSPEALTPLRDVFHRNQQGGLSKLVARSRDHPPGAGCVLSPGREGPNLCAHHRGCLEPDQVRRLSSLCLPPLSGPIPDHSSRTAGQAHARGSTDPRSSLLLLGNVYIHPTAKVAPSAVLGPNVSIGKGVTVGEGVRLRESIVLHGATLQEHTCVLHSIVGWGSTVGRWARVEGTPNDPNPNDPRARMDSESLFKDGKLLPAITILGCRVRIPAEVLILNSIVLPHKELSRSFTNQIIL